MKKISIHVQKEFCAECSLAIMRFMQSLDGIEAVEPGEGEVSVTFDEQKISGAEVDRIARENIEKLGYRTEG